MTTTPTPDQTGELEIDPARIMLTAESLACINQRIRYLEALAEMDEYDVKEADELRRVIDDCRTLLLKLRPPSN